MKKTGKGFVTNGGGKVSCKSGPSYSMGKVTTKDGHSSGGSKVTPQGGASSSVGKATGKRGIKGYGRGNSRTGSGCSAM